MKVKVVAVFTSKPQKIPFKEFVRVCSSYNLDKVWYSDGKIYAYLLSNKVIFNEKENTYYSIYFVALPIYSDFPYQNVNYIVYHHYKDTWDALPAMPEIKPTDSVWIINILKVDNFIVRKFKEIEKEDGKDEVVEVTC